MDLIGCASFFMPGLGIVLAPVSAVIFYFAFGKRKAVYGALFNFVEEIIPFTDIIPTFTIAWIWQKHFAQKKLTANFKR